MKKKVVYFIIYLTQFLTILFANDNKPTSEFVFPSISDCKNYLIVPIQHTKQSHSEHISKKIHKEIALSDLGCDNIVPYEDSLQSLALIGFEHHNYAEIKFLPPEQRQHLIQWTKATHLILLLAKENKQKSIVEPVLMRLDPFRIESIHSKIKKEYPVEIEVEFEEKTKNDKYTKYIKFVPNSMSFNLLNLTQIADTASSDTYDITGVKDHSFAPKIFSAIGFTDIIPTYALNLFEINYHFYPSLAFKSLNQTLTLESNTQESHEKIIEYRFTHYSMTPHYNVELSMLGKGGVFFIGYGLGATFYHHEDNYGTDTKDYVLTQKFFAGMRMMIQKSFFAELSAVGYLLKDPIIDNDYITFKTLGSGFLGIGYFYPAGKRQLSQWFSLKK